MTALSINSHCFYHPHVTVSHCHDPSSEGSFTQVRSKLAKCLPPDITPGPGQVSFSFHLSALLSGSFRLYGPTLSCPLPIMSQQAYWGNVQGLPVKHLDVPVAEEVAD